MTSQSSWELQTRELLGLIHNEIEEIQAECNRRINDLKKTEWAIEESLRAYMSRIGTQAKADVKPLSSDDIQGKTHREILRLIAERSSGILIAKNAVKLMREANVFGNPDNANAIVYNILNRTPEFHKVGKGIYRLNGTNITGKHRSRVPSHSNLADAIRRLKEQNPQITKREVIRILKRDGFDFQGKMPANAVHMTWVNMGYHKRESLIEFSLQTSDQPAQLQLSSQTTTEG